jgi:hypothetical protein
MIVTALWTWLGFNGLILLIGTVNYWRYAVQTFTYTAVLVRESTGSQLQLSWRLPAGKDEGDFIDSIMETEYPDWQIGFMSISTT